MADVQSPRVTLTVSLPSDLVEELQQVARAKRLSVDDFVMEACLAYTEPHLWERDYAEWRRQHPETPAKEIPVDGQELSSAAAGEGRK